MKVLVVVDMQNDFIDGVLGTTEAQAVVPAVAQKIRSWDGDIFVTMDTHDSQYAETQKGRNLPILHCIENTEGQAVHQRVPEALTEKSSRGSNVEIIYKTAFGSCTLAEILSGAYLDLLLQEIHLAGVCTDICVISNALAIKAFLPEVPIVVDTACCAGVTPEAHRAALEAMKACQIKSENE